MTGANTQWTKWGCAACITNLAAVAATYLIMLKYC